MAQFYIHIADPGFPDPPWEGQRRLGPFNTKEEAVAQAASDTAMGAGEALGVFTGAESDKGKDDTSVMTATVTTLDVNDLAKVIVEAEITKQLGEQAEDRAALVSILPEGVTIADIEGRA